MLSNLQTMVKSIFGLMELSFRSINLTFLSHMIWITNSDQKRFKEIPIKLQFISLNVRLLNGEKILKLAT